MSRGSPGSDRVSSEIRDLRDELRLLVRRVDQVCDRVDELHEHFANIASGDQSGYLGGFGEIPQGVSASAGAEPSSFGLQEPEVPPAVDPHGPSWSEREEVAAGIGRFFVRALNGGQRGDSGRDRIGLASRIYVVVKDHSGAVSTNPVRVFQRFTDVKRLCSGAEGHFGDSIFCGFPSIREARCAVATAGFSWPSNIN